MNTIKAYIPKTLKNAATTTLLVFIAFGIFMRVWDLGGDGLRLDESQSVWQASHSLEFIRAYMLKNVHLPLHNSLLHGWMLLFGSGEIAVRLLALIPGLLAIPAFYLLSREFLRKNWAFFATTIASLSPFWVWYSREIRMYSLLALITILSYYFYIKIIKSNRSRWYVCYAAVNVIGIYTHYFFFLVLLVQLVFFLATWRVHWHTDQPHNKTQMFVRLLIAAAALLVIFAPWMYILTNNYGSGSLAPVLEKPRAFNIVLHLFEFTFGFQPDALMPILVATWPVAILVGFLFLSRRHPFSYLIFLLFLGILIPIMVGFAASQYMPLFLSRYFIIVTPLLFIFIAWFVSELSGKSRTIVGAGIIVALTIFLINQEVNPSVPTKENYREAAWYVAERAGPRDIVVVSPPYIIYPIQYYYRGNARLSSLPIWDKRKGGIPTVTKEILEQDVNELKTAHKRIFLIESSDLLGAAQSKSYLDRRFTKLEKKQFSKNVWLHVYQTEYPAIKQTTHTVVSGESISKIALRYYSDMFLYKKILDANPSLGSGELIHPGDVIVIPR